MQTCAPIVQENNFLGIQTIRLWPGAAPEAKGTACEDIPTLTVFNPPQGSENGSAVIEAVVKARPSSAKGRFVDNIALAATMLPSIAVDASPYLKS